MLRLCQPLLYVARRQQICGSLTALPMIVTQSLRIERSHLLQQYATASAEHAEQSDAALTEKLDSYCVYPDIPEQPFSSYKKQDFDKLRKPRILSQLTGLITKDGKKARAEKIIQTALEKIRADMNEDPVKLLEIAVSAIEPLVRMATVKKSAKSFLYPVPLNERQRRRKALLWIIDGSKRHKPREMGIRLAIEIESVLDGSSSAYTKKAAIHQQALTNRANIPQ